MGGRSNFGSEPAGWEALNPSPETLVPEPVLTVSQMAERLQIDRHVVTRLFANERGVICIGSAETCRGKRKYRNLRVPLSVFNRIIARFTNK